MIKITSTQKINQYSVEAGGNKCETCEEIHVQQIQYETQRMDTTCRKKGDAKSERDL